MFQFTNYTAIFLTHVYLTTRPRVAVAEYLKNDVKKKITQIKLPYYFHYILILFNYVR